SGFHALGENEVYGRLRFIFFCRQSPWLSEAILHPECMRDVILTHAWAILKGTGTGLFLSMPVIVLLAWIYRRTKYYKAEREDPFTDLPLRPAGETLRLKIDDLADEQMSTLMIALLAPV